MLLTHMGRPAKGEDRHVGVGSHAYEGWDPMDESYRACHMGSEHSP